MAKSTKPPDLRANNQSAPLSGVAAYVLCTIGVIVLGIIDAYAWVLADKLIGIDLGASSYGRRNPLGVIAALIILAGSVAQLFLLVFYPVIVAGMLQSQPVFEKANKVPSFLVGLWFALLAEYIVWVTWLYAMTGTLSLFPSEIAAGMTLVVEHGKRPLFKAIVGGTIGWGLWGVEALFDSVVILLRRVFFSEES